MTNFDKLLKAAFDAGARVPNDIDPEPAFAEWRAAVGQ